MSLPKREWALRPCVRCHRLRFRSAVQPCRGASLALGEALVSHLRTVLSGSAAWDGIDTIRTAIEIRAGVVRNLKVLTFQRRHEEHPHPIHVEHC